MRQNDAFLGAEQHRRASAAAADADVVVEWVAAAFTERWRFLCSSS
jgi:hypothetical protein